MINHNPREPLKKFDVNVVILTIMGTRPQYVKCAVLRTAYKEAGIDNSIGYRTYDSNMSIGIFQQLNVPEPDIKLALGGSRSAQQWVQ